MTESDYILLGALFLFGFTLVYLTLSKTDHAQFSQRTGDKRTEKDPGVSEAEPVSHRKWFSDHQSEASENPPGSRNGNWRDSANTQQESANNKYSGKIEGRQDNSPGSQKESSSRAKSSATGDAQRAALRKAEAHSAAAEVMEELLQSSGTLLQRVHRMKSNDVGILLSVMSNKLKEEVDGGWEPEPLDEAGFEATLKDFMEFGAKFANGSSKDLVAWEERSEEYQKFLQQFAYFLNVFTLGRMTVAGVSHREAAAILLERKQEIS